MKVILLENYSGGPWNQNWTKRVMKNSRALMDSEKGVGWLELVACVGFVGEDPSPAVGHTFIFFLLLNSAYLPLAARPL